MDRTFTALLKKEGSAKARPLPCVRLNSHPESIMILWREYWRLLHQWYRSYPSRQHDYTVLRQILKEPFSKFYYTIWHRKKITGWWAKNCRLSIFLTYNSTFSICMSLF